jgi:lipoprotein-anchoring transpeptidase ErfK/SrfK
MARRLLVLVVSALLATAALGSLPVLSAHALDAVPVPPVFPPSDPPSPEPHATYPPLPADSGEGRRIVYSRSEQRVWIVESDETVSGSWLVSGRKETPKPGTYSIYSRSRWASAGRVRMEFMLRFVKTSGKAIGFHAIPVDSHGRPIQSESELGQPRSHGCVRQARADAEHLWNWAPNGTAVRVTA